MGAWKTDNYGVEAEDRLDGNHAVQAFAGASDCEEEVDAPPKRLPFDKCILTITVGAVISAPP